MQKELNSNPRTVIVTGGNSGLGYACAKNIARMDKQVHVVLACRDAKKAQEAVSTLVRITRNVNISSLELDLASLDSIRSFVFKFLESNYPPLYALVCNAGLIMVDKTYFTKDGFEATFGVNHLGHFLLTNLLLGSFSDAGRILFVSSGTHDPSQNTGIAEPVYENARLLAYPNDTKSVQTMMSMIRLGQRRYTTSKLCNILCAYELDERIRTQTKKSIAVNSFNPGQMAGTGFSRTFPPIVRIISNFIVPFLGLFKPNSTNTEKSGVALATLVMAREYQSISGRYFDGTHEMKSSELSYNKEVRRDLWRTSSELTGLTTEEAVLSID